MHRYACIRAVANKDTSRLSSKKICSDVLYTVAAANEPRAQNPDKGLQALTAEDIRKNLYTHGQGGSMSHCGMQCPAQPRPLTRATPGDRGQGGRREEAKEGGEEPGDNYYHCNPTSPVGMGGLESFLN